MAKQLTLYEKWEIDSKMRPPVNFSDEKQNLTKNITKDDVQNIIDKIEKVEKQINGGKMTKDSAKELKKN